MSDDEKSFVCRTERTQREKLEQLVDLGHQRRSIHLVMSLLFRKEPSEMNNKQQKMTLSSLFVSPLAVVVVVVVTFNGQLAGRSPVLFSGRKQTQSGEIYLFVDLKVATTTTTTTKAANNQRQHQFE